MNILHILNGDSMLLGFEQTGIEGDIMVWREVFSEGPLQEDISSAAFWENRQTWISGTVDETSENYQRKVIDELDKLREPYDEINLWFEFDLHCQVNLLGVINFLLQKTDLSAPSIYLICPGSYPGKENFMGMGELDSDELAFLFDNVRNQLDDIDFILATEAWDVYVKQDADKLKKYLAATNFWASLHLLKPALEAHLQRLVVNKNGLNYIEQRLLDIYNEGSKTRETIYRNFWKTEKIYGMGDKEIDIYLRSLTGKGLIYL